MNAVDVEMPACSLSAARSVEQTMDLLLAAGHPRMPGAMFACMYVPSPLQPALQSLDPDLENCEFALITHRPLLFFAFSRIQAPLRRVRAHPPRASRPARDPVLPGQRTRLGWAPAQEPRRECAHSRFCDLLHCVRFVVVRSSLFLSVVLIDCLISLKPRCPASALCPHLRVVSICAIPVQILSADDPTLSVLLAPTMPHIHSIFAAYITNALIWTFAPSQLFQIGVTYGVALPALLGSRLLLNLRGAHQRAHRFTPTMSMSHTTRWEELLLPSPGAGGGNVGGGGVGLGAGAGGRDSERQSSSLSLNTYEYESRRMSLPLPLPSTNPSASGSEDTFLGGRAEVQVEVGRAV